MNQKSSKVTTKVNGRRYCSGGGGGNKFSKAGSEKNVNNDPNLYSIFHTLILGYNHSPRSYHPSLLVPFPNPSLYSCIQSPATPNIKADK